MGLLEQINLGARFTRTTVQLPTGPVVGNTDEFGPSYILLGVSATAPCRVRLYFDSASRVIDESRPSSSFDINPEVGLVLDTTLIPGTQSISFDPPIFGTTLLGSDVWYTVSGSAVVQFSVYPIESSTVNDRRTINIRRTGLDFSGQAEGTVTVPKSFLLLSASATSESRLRLYSRPLSEVPSVEKARPFGTAPLTGSSLIADLLFDSASFPYKISPILQGYNLQSYPDGTSQLHYLVENSSSFSPITYTASLHLYSLED